MLAVFQRVGLATLALVSLVSAASALESADRTGTGGGPHSTITAPNTTSVGQTKPPGSLGPDLPGQRHELDSVRRRNNAIEDSICVGCSVK